MKFFFAPKNKKSVTFGEFSIFFAANDPPKFWSKLIALKKINNSKNFISNYFFGINPNVEFLRKVTFSSEQWPE